MLMEGLQIAVATNQQTDRPSKHNERKGVGIHMSSKLAAKI